MKHEMQIERIGLIVSKRIKAGEKVGKHTVADLVEKLLFHNLRIARANRAVRADLATARYERDMWRVRFEALRKTVAQAAQPQTWGAND